MPIARKFMTTAAAASPWAALLLQPAPLGPDLGRGRKAETCFFFKYILLRIDSNTEQKYQTLKTHEKWNAVLTFSHPPSHNPPTKEKQKGEKKKPIAKKLKHNKASEINKVGQQGNE